MQAPTETLREKLTRVNNELRAAGRPDSFYLSLEGSWNRYGSLTERQEAALRQSFERREERAAARAQEAAPTQPMPTGRVTISGEILTTKWQDSRFGGSLKMLLKSEFGWKVWGTVPASLTYGGPNHVESPLKGRRVTFTATVEPKEAAFGFFSRPTNARLLPEAQPEAERATSKDPVWDKQLEAAHEAIQEAKASPVAPIVRAGMADIIAKAKQLEAGKWDTDSMVA